MTLNVSQPPVVSSQNLTTEFTADKIELIKNTICKNSTDEELQLFLHACKRTGLDPFMKQIHAVKRRSMENGSWKETLSIQTGIDGYRLIADRTGKYCPGRETTYVYDKEGKLFSATSYVKKQTADGTWHEVAATALFSEYCQRNNKGEPTRFWQNFSHTMLAKCFDSETEVLTEFGFKKFSDVNGRIMQVTPNGLEPVNAKPFSQDYSGEMICYEHRDLDFSVTPNHNMLTTSGVLEAGTMYELSRARPSFFIPRLTPEDKSKGLGLTQAQCELAAACLCDGDHMSSKKFRIKVSRPHKVQKIRSWNLHEKETLRNTAGKSAVHSCGRTITTKNDQIEFTFSMDKIYPLIIPYKRLNHENMLNMNSQEAKWFVDAWVIFDGNGNSGGGYDRTRRIWTSDSQYVSWLELLGIKAGYSISPIASRMSDIGTKPNFIISFSENNEIGVCRWGRFVEEISKPHPSLFIKQNESGKVWCVTVPSGTIVVRRHGFSMLCKNCAESGALRKAFPAELSGIYTQEEMMQSEKEEKEEKASIPELTEEEMNAYFDLWEKERNVKRVDIEEFMKYVVKVRKWTFRACRDAFEKDLEITKQYFQNWLEKKSSTSQQAEEKPQE